MSEIANLPQRIDYWSSSRAACPSRHDMRDSIPYPWGEFTWMFADKDVLEIGPGKGRQYDYLKWFTRSYSIADISQVVIDDPVFADCKSKYLIDGYQGLRYYGFDLVHFWYVLHHIRSNELSSFFSLVSRYLKSGGFALFNTPWLGNASNMKECYPGDGIGTTWIDEKMVRDTVEEWFNVAVCLNVDRLSNGYLFILKRK